MPLNTDTLNALPVFFRDDPDTLECILHAMNVFENYHRAIFELEIEKKLYTGGAMPADEYRETIMRLDRSRTVAHNAVIAQVSLLNKLAAEAGLKPVYDGVISEERPYRRQIADAVLDHVRSVIVARA